jgi:hypothetical protein
MKQEMYLASATVTDCVPFIKIVASITGQGELGVRYIGVKFENLPASNSSVDGIDRIFYNTTMRL